jgi:hypothetical protein
MSMSEAYIRRRYKTYLAEVLGPQELRRELEKGDQGQLELEEEGSSKHVARVPYWEFSMGLGGRLDTVL